MTRPLNLSAVRRDDLLLDRLGRGAGTASAAAAADSAAGAGAADSDLDEVALLLAGWRAEIRSVAESASPAASPAAAPAVASAPDLVSLPGRRSGRASGRRAGGAAAGRRPALVGLILAGALVSAGGAAAASVGVDHGRLFWSVSQLVAPRHGGRLPTSPAPAPHVRRSVPAPLPARAAAPAAGRSSAAQPLGTRRPSNTPAGATTAGPGAGTHQRATRAQRRAASWVALRRPRHVSSTAPGHRTPSTALLPSGWSSGDLGSGVLPAQLMPGGLPAVLSPAGLPAQLAPGGLPHGVTPSRRPPGHRPQRPARHSVAGDAAPAPPAVGTCPAPAALTRGRVSVSVRPGGAVSCVAWSLPTG